MNTKAIQEISELILAQVRHNSSCGKDDKFTVEEISGIIKRRVVDVFEPENIYKKDVFYDYLGHYIGVVDTYPSGADYFVRNHHFRIPSKDSNSVCEVRRVFIREIKK